MLKKYKFLINKYYESVAISNQVAIKPALYKFKEWYQKEYERFYQILLSFNIH